MPQIPAAIPTQAFELIRNRIAEILVDELPSQATLQGDAKLNARVFVERFVRFDLTELPAVNVSLNRTAYSEQTQRNTDGEHTFNIDVHTSAKSTSSVRGDELAQFRLQKLLGVCRGILEDSRYKTLGFNAGFIESRKVTTMEFAQPTEGDGTSSVVGRLTFVVRAPDRNGVVTPELIAGYDTQVKLALTNKGYIFTGDNIPVPPVIGPDINVNGDLFVVADPDVESYDIPVLNSDGDEVGDVTAGVSVVVPDGAYTLNGTDGTELATGSIPSGGSAVIVAPDATVLRDGQPFGSVPSGGTIDVPSAVTPCDPATVELNGVEVASPASGATVDIPVIQDGSPVGTWNGTQWVVPASPTVASLAVTVSDTTPTAGDTITITATPSGFTPTSYQFLLFNGSITLLAQQAGNAYNWTVNVPAGNYSIYVLATDGTTDVFATEGITVQGVYLLGLYPDDCITDFAPFRLLGGFTGRIMEVRRLVGSTTTAVEIGLDGDYVTLDSPVLSVTVGSSSATTLGSFVNSSGYPNQDSLPGAQSAFVVRGYRQLNGALAWEQTTAANQPRLVNSGTLDVLGAFGCLRFLGNQWQDYGLISGLNKPANYSILSVASFDSTGAMGLYGSRPAGSGQTPFSYGHIWKQPSGSSTITTLYGDGINQRIATTLTSPIVVTSMQLFEDYKSSGVLDSDLYVDGSGPIPFSGTGSALNVFGAATRMLFGRFGDSSGNILTGRQLMFVVYEGNKSADRLGMKNAINSILGTSW